MSIPVLTLSQFAAQRGLTTTADVDSHIHASLANRPNTKTFRRWYERRLAELQAARDETTRLYWEGVARGDWREPSLREDLEARANGHEDNPSTHAARRVLARMAERERAEAEGRDGSINHTNEDAP